MMIPRIGSGFTGIPLSARSRRSREQILPHWLESVRMERMRQNRAEFLLAEEWKRSCSAHTHQNKLHMIVSCLFPRTWNTESTRNCCLLPALRPDSLPTCFPVNCWMATCVQQQLQAGDLLLLQSGNCCYSLARESRFGSNWIDQNWRTSYWMIESRQVVSLPILYSEIILIMIEMVKLFSSPHQFIRISGAFLRSFTGWRQTHMLISLCRKLSFSRWAFSRKHREKGEPCIMIGHFLHLCCSFLLLIIRWRIDGRKRNISPMMIMMLMMMVHESIVAERKA